MAVKAKQSKKKPAHEKAILRFIHWLGQNPTASRTLKYKTFDTFIDEEAA